MDRNPVVAGQFYPGNLEDLEAQVKQFLAQGAPKDNNKQSKLAMVPHAGYMFSGGIAGRTLATANPARKVLLLGPNHTGQGAAWSVWSDGEWKIPGSSLKVDDKLAQEILESDSNLQKDYAAHLHEHSLEVILPFLWLIASDTTIVPISVSDPKLSNLIQVGQAIANCLKNSAEPVSIVVSSDMSHFISQEQAKAKDKMALDAIRELDPEKLYNVVRSNNISMCGVLAMTTGLVIANALESSQAELIQYGTSGDIIGDYKQVVGYAGVCIW